MNKLLCLAINLVCCQNAPRLGIAFRIPPSGIEWQWAAWQALCAWSSWARGAPKRVMTHLR
jgi:hypothetical protein